MLNINDVEAFKHDPELQEKAFIALCSYNKFILKDEIIKNEGRVVQGIEITESGILAAAHLAGPGNVRKFLKSKGLNRFRDAYGTSMRNYIKKFSGYDTSFIKANEKPEV